MTTRGREKNREKATANYVGTTTSGLPVKLYGVHGRSGRVLAGEVLRCTGRPARFTLGFSCARRSVGGGPWGFVPAHAFRSALCWSGVVCPPPAPVAALGGSFPPVGRCAQWAPSSPCPSFVGAAPLCSAGRYRPPVCLASLRLGAVVL